MMPTLHGATTFEVSRLENGHVRLWLMQDGQPRANILMNATAAQDLAETLWRAAYVPDARSTSAPTDD